MQTLYLFRLYFFVNTIFIYSTLLAKIYFNAIQLDVEHEGR